MTEDEAKTKWFRPTEKLPTWSEAVLTISCLRPLRVSVQSLNRERDCFYPGGTPICNILYWAYLPEVPSE